MKLINDATNNKQQKVTAFFPIRRSARKTKNVVNEEKQVALEKAILSKNEDGLKVITIFHLTVFLFELLCCFVSTDSCIS